MTTAKTDNMKIMETARKASAEDSFGYFGTLEGSYGKRTHRLDAQIGAELVKLGLTTERATEFLRSRMGRHLADTLSFFGMPEAKRPEWCQTIGKAVRSHYRHFVSVGGA